MQACRDHQEEARAFEALIAPIQNFLHCLELLLCGWNPNARFHVDIEEPKEQGSNRGQESILRVAEKHQLTRV